MDDFLATADEEANIASLEMLYNEGRDCDPFEHCEPDEETSKLLPLADLAAWSSSSPKPKAFVAPGLVPEGEVTKLDGAGGSNKSTALQQLFTCRAAGVPFLGVDIKPGISLYLSAEDDFDRLEWMHEHICRAIDVDRQSVVGKLHLSSIRGRLNNELATFDASGSLQPTKAFRELQATIEATGADLVGLDNVAHLFSGNENDRAQVTAFVNLLYSLGVTVILIGHPNKSGDTYSGSTAWLNAIRSQLVIERSDGSDRDVRVLKVGKANYARTDTEIEFRWHDFALWRDTDLPPDTQKALAETSRSAGDNEIFLTCLREMTRQKRAVSEKANAANYAVKVFARMPESKGIGAPRLEEAMDRLFRLGFICRDNLWKGPDRKWVVGLREGSNENPVSV